MSNESKNNDLLQQLAAETETKTPGTGNNVIESNFWDKKEDQETIENKETTNTTTAANTDTTQNETKQTTEETKTERPKKLDKEIKEASARTMVGMIDFTQKAIFIPAINYKFKKKFNDDEINRLDAGAEDADKNTLEGEDLAVRNKWDRLMKKRDKKIDAVPFTEPETKDITLACFNYMDVKEKELPPELFLYLTIGTILGKRAIDVFFD